MCAETYQTRRSLNPTLKPTRITRYDLPMSRRLFDIAGPHEVRALYDVAVNLLLDHRDNLGFPVVVEIALADQLRNVPLVDVVPIQPVGRAAVQFFAAPEGQVRGHYAPGDVDGLQFDGQKLAYRTV